jgi:Tol biopolymer transport system component
MRTAALAGCAAVLLLATQLHAATLFDPALRFRMRATEHFIIYYHQGEEQLARRLAAIAEETWARLRQPFGVDPPRRTHVVLADQTELANGYATPLPYDTIVLYTVWPAGSEFIGDVDDWLRVAFTHEFTHIVHLDRSESWARVVRGIFGRVTLAFPNVFLPTWQIEGLATYAESVVTGHGRLHAGDFTAVVTEAAVKQKLEPLDRVNGGLTDWPGGATPYAYGVGFHNYLASRFGVETLGALASATAGRVPYTASRAFNKVYGRPLGELWREYERTLDPQPRASSVAVGGDGLKTLPYDAGDDVKRLTHHGFTVLGPRFDRHSPGNIYYSVRNADEFPSLYRVSLNGGRPERLVRRYLGSTTAVGREAMYFDEQERRRNVGVYSDIYVRSPDAGRTRRLTKDARLLEPDLSPDERTLVAVQDRPGQRDLVLVHLKSDGATNRITIETLVAGLETQFNAPRWSPDGRRIAAERHVVGALSEIVVVDVDTRTARTVASFDRARAVTPAWRPDGAAIVAAVAPEEQPFNLYEFAIGGASPPRQLTALTGGATWPDISPDGKTIVFVGYTVDGFDVFSMEYPSPGAGPAALSRPSARERAEPQETVSPQGGPADAPYSPLPTLRPTSWSPIVEGDSTQLRVGAAIDGVDVLGYHFYSASATWLASGPAEAPKPNAAEPDWQVSYFYDRWRPTVFASASSATSFFAGPASDNGTPTEATLRQRQIQAGVVVPIRHTRVSHTALASMIRAVNDYTLPAETISRNRTAARAAWGTTTAHTYGYSISPEGGFAAGATIEVVRRGLGSFADATTATVDARAYLPGVAEHQVVAIRLAGGASSGDSTVGRTFLLGGPTTDPGIVSFGSSAFSLLRGFPSNTFAGSHVAVANADYRFPIARPQRGHGTWPLFVHTIHGAFFADAGNAWTRAFRSNAIKTSFGAELSLNIVAGYFFPFTIAAGAAWGHDPTGVVGDGAAMYVRIGKAF